MIYIVKQKRKWNRVHFFSNEKKDSVKGKYREHPALIFERSGKQCKAVVFTTNATTNGQSNVLLKHNVDPNNSEKCYGVPYCSPRLITDFQPPKKKYRVHIEDKEIVKQLKYGKKKR